MNFALNNDEVQALRDAVEQRLGAGVSTPSEFKRLADNIKKETRRGLSVSTLMRLWGYVKSDMTPNTTTLNTLAVYAGYHDWEAFVAGDRGDNVSETVLSRHLYVDRELEERDHVVLRWSPGRECLVRYLGAGQFVVERSVRSKLCVGDTFTCHLIVEGHRLYLNNLVHEAEAAHCYVCGLINGIHFEVLKAEREMS